MTILWKYLQYVIINCPKFNKEQKQKSGANVYCSDYKKVLIMDRGVRMRNSGTKVLTHNLWRIGTQYVKKNSVIAFTCLAVLGVGLYHEYLSAIYSVILSIRIIQLIIKTKKIVFKLNSVSIFVAVMMLGYIVSCLWAVDSGVTLFGFLKFLPIFLFLILCFQEKTRSEDILNVLPYLMAFITIITAILMSFKRFERLFSVAGRLAGTFQYSNTYAVLCLICIIIVLADKKINWINISISIILILGILYSGSRTVFVLMGITIIVLFFRMKDKKIKCFLAIASIGAISIFVLYAIIMDNIDIVSRFLKISLGESTFVGRLLYWHDALPQIVRHPFGTGYMGYFFSQAAFKTGVYSVRFVHNDFLQLLLDVGWIPFVLLCTTIVKTIFSKTVSFTRKFSLLIFSAHMFFDFDLQFVAMFIIFILLLDWDSGKEYKLTKIKGSIVAACIVILVNIYFGAALFFHYIGKHEFSLAMYKYNTFANIERLQDITNYNELNELSDFIISQNKYVSLAYNAKARYAYSQGDFYNVIKWKQEAIKNNYYDMVEYEDMFKMLMMGATMYQQAGDTYSYEYCIDELRSIPDYIEEAEEKISVLGKKIKDQPELEFSEELKSYIKELEAYEN